MNIGTSCTEGKKQKARGRPKGASYEKRVGVSRHIHSGGASLVPKSFE